MIPRIFGEPSDAGKRTSDLYNMHRLADPIGSIGHWFAVKLSDGRSADMNALYPDKRACVTHQPGDERLYAYIQIVPATMTPQMADVFLATMRKLYDAGIRLADPDHRAGGVDMIRRIGREDQQANVLAALRRGRPTNLIVGKDRYN